MKVRVLFLAANPEDLVQLNLAREVDEIRAKLTQAEFGDQIELVVHPSTQPDDLIQLFSQDDDWHIVHFSGHGSKAHEMLLTGEDGKAARVSKEALQRVFECFGRKVRVVIFNACYAEGQARAVTEHVDCAIGMSEAVGDSAAILFAASFYRAIGFGQSVAKAFELGQLAIDLNEIPESDTPRLHARDGFDPKGLSFLSGAPIYHLPNEWTQLAPPPPALGEGHRWHTFLSHRSVHRPWAMKLYDVLYRHGYGSFLDQFSLRVGDSLEEQLDRGLSESRTGVLLWSPENADSEWCMKEFRAMLARRGREEDFHFVTLRLKGELPEEVAGDVWLDFSEHADGPNGDALMRLLFALADQPMTPKAAEFAVRKQDEARQITRRLEGAVELGNVDGIRDLAQEGGVLWSSSASLGSVAAEALVRLAAYDEALTLLDHVQEGFPRAVRPKQLRALALARRGQGDDLMQAREILTTLRADGHRDPETLGILARTWMDTYVQSGKRRDLRKSRKLYADAFEHAPDDTYTGINAAAKSVMLGDLEAGCGYARRVLERLEQAPPTEYWGHATRAEAHLILGDHDLAVQGYDEAVLDHSEEAGSHAATLLQARRLREPLGLDDALWTRIEDCFE